MPWEHVWRSTPSDKALTVAKELPEGVHNEGFGGNASGVVNDQLVKYHHCDQCGGWIPGDAYEAGENTMGPLSGRRGTAYHCRRCGHETGFVGCYS